MKLFYEWVCNINSKENSKSNPLMYKAKPSDLSVHISWRYIWVKKVFKQITRGSKKKNNKANSYKFFNC